MANDNPVIGILMAKRKTVNCGDGRTIERLDSIKYSLAETSDFIGLFGRLDRRKLGDVRAHDEATMLAREQHEPSGRRFLQRSNQRVQLRHDFIRQDIRIAVRLVDSDPDDARIVSVGSPVFHRHSCLSLHDFEIAYQGMVIREFDLWHLERRYLYSLLVENEIEFFPR